MRSISKQQALSIYLQQLMTTTESFMIMISYNTGLCYCVTELEDCPREVVQYWFVLISRLV